MNNKKLIFSSLFIFLLLIVTALFCTVFGNDEIWNYGFVISIYRGLVPYRDFNMVITPFFPFIMSLPFHVFGCNELILQVTNCLFLTLLFVFLDKIIGDKKYVVLLFLIFPLSLVFPSYNMFSFIIFVVILYCENAKKNDYLIGLLLGLLFLTKQSVGFCVMMIGIFFNFRDLKKMGKRFLGFIFPIMITSLYLIFNNAFSDFIDLCFMGLIDFGDENLSLPFIMTLIFILLIINALYYIRKNPKSIFNYYILAFYSIMVPLIDIYHVQVAFLACIILNFYNLNIDKKYDRYLCMFSITSFIGVALSVFVNAYPYTYPCDINHFEYRLIPDKNINMTKKVNDYILNHSDREIYLLGADAYYFKIIQDKDINKLDLVNDGNWGYNGGKKIVNEIKKHDDALFIIYDVDFNKKSQINKDALYYVKNNFNKIDTVGVYDVYSKK